MATGRWGRIAATVILKAAFVCSMSGMATAGSTSMATFGRTSQPIGHFNFCKRYPEECSVKSPFTPPEAMTDDLLDRLLKVNAAVNAAVKPMEDIDIFGEEEVWTYPERIGDCEDYVLEKRRILAQSGIPLANLLITVVRQSSGAGHAVLTVRTRIGDYVLDNLSPNVLPWDHTGYRYIKRQSAWDTGEWVSIRDGEAPMVGSVH
jgi:predicted transglutaminase-like cysteine proteinase